ncbi:YwqG family protein [Enterococcus sp. LJL120]
MEWLKRLFSREKGNTSHKIQDETDDAVLETLWQEVERQIKNYPRKSLRLTFQNTGELSLTASKLGGVGYLPIGLDYPTNSETNQSLSSLAQLNFDELPHLGDFPHTGLLAIYVDFFDDMYGMDFSDHTCQTGFRFFYFEEYSAVSQLRATLENHVKPLYEEALYPLVGGEYQLFGEIQTEYLASNCFEFTEKFGNELIEWFDQLTEGNQIIVEELVNRLSVFNNECSKLGGYPFFTQDEPRNHQEAVSFDTVLLQIDSFWSPEMSLMWGDNGVANFFISRDDLLKKNFSKVYYNWDCC